MGVASGLVAAAWLARNRISFEVRGATVTLRPPGEQRLASFLESLPQQGQVLGTSSDAFRPPHRGHHGPAGAASSSTQGELPRRLEDREADQPDPLSTASLAANAEQHEQDQDAGIEDYAMQRALEQSRASADDNDLATLQQAIDRSLRMEGGDLDSDD